MLKTAPKILISAFLIIFIAQMFGLIFLLAVPASTQAADDIKFIPQVGIGEFKQGEGVPVLKTVNGTTTSTLLPEYIRAIYKYAIGVVGILAAVVLMVGGIVWITAGGNQARIGEAKAWIGASLTGLIIALSSYTLLWMVNPALVQFRPIKVSQIKDNSKNAKGFSADVDYFDLYSFKCASVEECTYPWSTAGLTTVVDSTYCGDILIKDTDTCSLTWVCCQCLSTNKDDCKKIDP